MALIPALCLRVQPPRKMTLRRAALTSVTATTPPGPPSKTQRAHSPTTGAEAPGRAGSCPPSDVRKTQNLAKEIWEPSPASHSQLKKKQTGTESLWTLWLRDEAPSGRTRRVAGELGMKRSLPPKGARAHDTICSPSTPCPISSVTKL